jgi:hypothetical protein
MTAMEKLVERLVADCGADFTRPIANRKVWVAGVHGDTIRVRGGLEEVVVAVFTGSDVLKYEVRFAADNNRLTAPRPVVIATINAAIQCMGEPVHDRWQDG